MTSLGVCLIGKYPPIQGGVAKENYWLARWLAESGHRVTVITNAFEVEEPYRIYLEGEDLAWLQYNLSSRGGGRVVLRNSDPLSSNPYYVPFSKPFVSKLAGIAIDEIERNSIDIVFSYYLEPYGVAGHLAASLTGKPHLLCHAGSDFFKLRKNESLGPLYVHLFRSASGIITSGTGGELMRSWGINSRSLHLGYGEFIPASHFNPQADPLDVNALLQRMASFDRPFVESILGWPIKEFDPGIPTIGLYGKVAESKGAYDLVEALSLLKKRGKVFNFLAMSGGRELDRLKTVIRERGLEGNTWFIPFLPHWRVPGFIRACTAVCFLERDFWLPCHTPRIPREVMYCGVCLVLSTQAAKIKRATLDLRDGDNFISAADPRDTANLAERLSTVIDKPEIAGAIGWRGYESIRSHYDNPEEVARYYIDLFNRTIRDHERRRSE